MVTVSNKLGVKSLKELIERAKKEPGALNYGSVGIGSSQHLAGEYFSQVTGVKLTHVPYRNIAQYGPDLIAGQVPARLPVVSERRRPDQRQRRDGARGRRRRAARGVARHADHDARPACRNTRSTAGSRWPLRPGVPAPIMERLNKEINDALNDPAVKSGFEKAGAGADRIGLEQAKKFHADEIVKYRDIITKAGIAKIE